MNSTEALVRLSLIDGELGKLRARDKELDGQLNAQRNALLAEEKKVQQLERDASTATRGVQATLALLKNEREQYSRREKQILEMGGVKSAKHISSENDRATLVIEALEKELATKKEQLSVIETSYLETEESLDGKKQRFTLSEKEMTGQLVHLRERIKQIESTRAEMVKNLDPQILPNYENLKKRYPEAVATIEENACSICYTMIPLRISNSVRAGMPLECPGCNRLLVTSFVIDEGSSTEELI